ncbi:hypothetical protein [Cryptosporangium sp. NPDC051539]|uniref:hypothetical protein n=1 Tax=Cryptosporangium sp. NPDC051539 TaxID=3363962 RepID=UPI0037BA5124
MIVLDWPGLPTAKRLTFSGLALLGLYLLRRTYAAVHALRTQDPLKFVGHVGFVLISLFDGFAIVSALDLHLPGVAVALSAVLGVVVGVVAVRRAGRIVVPR